MINVEEKNNAFTPEIIQEALGALPHNYLVLTKKLVGEKFLKGEISKDYSKDWIMKVKKGDAHNEEVLLALVEIGQAALNSPFSFLQKGKKKAPART